MKKLAVVLLVLWAGLAHAAFDSIYVPWTINLGTDSTYTKPDTVLMVLRYHTGAAVAYDTLTGIADPSYEDSLAMWFAVPTSVFAGGVQPGAWVRVKWGDGSIQRDDVVLPFMSNMMALSDDGPAVDNLETMLDGTGGQNLSLGRLVVSDNSANPAVSIQQQGSGQGLLVNNVGTGDAVAFRSAAGGDAFEVHSQGAGNAMWVHNTSSGVAANFEASADWGFKVQTASTNADTAAFAIISNGGNPMQLSGGAAAGIVGGIDTVYKNVTKVTLVDSSAGDISNIWNNPNTFKADVSALALEASLFDPATDLVQANVLSISADTAAADNFETMLDGVGGNELTLGGLRVEASTNDTGIVVKGSGTGAGLYIQDGGGAGANAVQFVGTSSGLYASGANGIYAQGATYGALVEGQGSAGAYFWGNSGADGIWVNGDNGIEIVAPSYDTALWIQGRSMIDGSIYVTADANDTNAINLIGNGAGSGLYSIGGATGSGARFIGGATSGNGIAAQSPVSGAGISASATTLGDGLRLVGAGNGGYGLDISGNGDTAVYSNQADSFLIPQPGAAATVDYDKIDSTLTANHGSGAWTSGGLGTGAYVCTTLVIDTSQAPDDTLTNFTVTIDDYSRTRKASGSTGSDGLQFIPNLDNENLTFAARGNWYFQENGLDSVAFPAKDTNITVLVYKFTPVAPSASDSITLVFNLPSTSYAVEVVPLIPGEGIVDTSGNILLPTPIYGKPDPSTKIAQVTVVESGAVSTGLEYKITVYNINTKAVIAQKTRYTTGTGDSETVSW